MYERWLKSPIVDDDTKMELRSIEFDEDEIRDRFSHVITFGTAGLRAKMRAGLDSMNVYTVRYVSQAIADFIKISQADLSRGITLSYDSRNNSRLFAEEAAGVFAANGIKVKIFDGIRPTPELSFAVRENHSLGGVNITASHNPKEYNGYKVYGPDGSQMPPQDAEKVADIIEKIDIFDDVKRTPFEAAHRKSMIEFIGSEIDKKYMEAVLAEVNDIGHFCGEQANIQIVYTPLHGTGAKFVPELLKRIGIDTINVEEQMVPDGDFPTVESPNPENFESFKMGIDLAKTCKADLVLASDPDGDRLGLVVCHDNKYLPLTGNQVGVLLLDFLIRMIQPDESNFVVKSLVSTTMANEICKRHDIKLIETPPGFKHVGEQIRTYEEEGEYKFFFAFEESNGYLKGSYTRDKDAMLAAVLVAKMACYYKAEGMTLIDAMEALYKKYGYYKDKNTSRYMDVVGGRSKMPALMDRIREAVPESLGGIKLIKVQDFLKGSLRDCKTGEEIKADMPEGNIIRYELEDGSTVTIRPSGTEPKIKLYVTVRGSDNKNADTKLERVVSDAEALLQT